VKNKKKRADRREEVFAGQDDDETLVTRRAQFLAILAMMSSTSGNSRKEFVSRDFNVAIIIRRCVVLKTRPDELQRSYFARQPLRL